MITRRDIVQLGAATAALIAGDGPFSRAMAQQRLTELELLKFDPLGNVTLLHVADIHGQLLPVYFREPAVNLGVGEARGQPPHYRRGLPKAFRNSWKNGLSLCADRSGFRSACKNLRPHRRTRTLDDLKRLPSVNRIYFLECAANSGMEWRGAQLNGCQYTHGMVHCVQYTGVTLKLLLEQAGLRAGAKWIMAEGGDSAAMNRSIPLGKALEDSLVAYRMNGEMLRPEQGYPVRLVVPGWEGNVWIKWLRRIKVGDQPWFTREETSKYTDLLENGKARQFTFIMDAKSVITSPSPQAPVKQKGFNVISGLAWSGRGKIRRVDVSLDGGRNWRNARIDGLVLDKACVRFYFDFEWNGEELLLQSRALDDTGYVQPSKDALRKVRGVNSIYHNNGIQTWALKRNGELENVEVG